jgi:membrane protein
MVTGLLLCGFIGVLSTLYPMFMKLATGHKAHPIEYGFWANFFATVMIGIIMVVKAFSLGSAEAVMETDFLKILIVMFTAAFFSSANSVLNMNAMRLGHSGLTTAINQSSMVLNFLLVIIIFRTPASIFNYIAIAVTFVSVFLLGMNRYKVKLNKNWLIFCITAFLASGIYQTISAIPSQFQYTDTINFRGFSFALGILLFFGIAKFALKIKNDPLCIKIGFFTGGFIATIVQFTMYKAMDLLALNDAVYMYYPIVTALTILLYSLYSMFVLKEKFRPLQILGLFGCAFGILLLII